MRFQSEPGIVRWKAHFASPPDAVFTALSTPEGRETFWADSAAELDAVITFRIGRYPPYEARIRETLRPRRFALEYFGTDLTSECEEDGRGGTDLHLTVGNVADEVRTEFIAGWVSVLLAMKAAVDFGVDLRNHDLSRTWLDGYADN